MVDLKNLHCASCLDVTQGRTDGELSIGPMEAIKELLSNHWGWVLVGLALLSIGHASVPPINNGTDGTRVASGAALAGQMLAMRRDMTTDNPDRPRRARVMVLFVLHAMVLYDAYILGLPMIMIMWKHWNHVALYCFAILLAFPSFVTTRHHALRGVLYFFSIAVLFVHWYKISSVVAYDTEPFDLTNVLASSPFLICVAVQTKGLLIRAIRTSANV